MSGTNGTNGHHPGAPDGTDLLAIADRVVASARPGEQVEAFVSRGGET